MDYNPVLACCKSRPSDAGADVYIAGLFDMALKNLGFLGFLKKPKKSDLGFLGF